MLGPISYNPYGTPNSVQTPEWMAPAQTLATRVAQFEGGSVRRGFDPLFDASYAGYQTHYPYNPAKWLLRYGVESTVGTKEAWANLKRTLFGAPNPAQLPSPSMDYVTRNLPSSNTPRWFDKWEKSLTQSQKLFNIADKHLNTPYLNNITQNPFAAVDNAFMASGGHTTAALGAAPLNAAASSPALYGTKALNYDELLGLTQAEKTRIAAVRQQYGWSTALKETFHGNRLKHAKDVLSEGGKTGVFKNFFKKVLINNEARWLAEPVKKGEVLPALLRPLSMGLLGIDWFKTTQRAYQAAKKEGKSSFECWWEAAKTGVTKGIKLFTTWHLGSAIFKGISLALGTAMGMHAIPAGIIAILGAVGVGWVANNAINKILPDPPTWE